MWLTAQLRYLSNKRKAHGDGSLAAVDQCPTMSALQVDVDDRASSTNLQSAEFSCGPVDVCDVTVSSGGSERKNSVRFNYAHNY